MNADLIIFRGRAGVGKSTVADAYAKKYQLAILRKDNLYDVCAVYIPDHLARNKISYDSLFSILKTNAGLGCGFVIDYSFQKEEEIHSFLQWATAQGYRPRSVLVTCSDEKVWAKRLSERGKNPAPNQLITDLDELRDYYGGDLHITPIDGEIVVDTISPVADILKILK